MGLSRPSQITKRPDIGGVKELREVNLTSQINGSTQLFTMPLKYKSGSLRVYWNGIRQIVGVTITENTTTTFQTSFVPQNGDYIIVDYYTR